MSGFQLHPQLARDSFPLVQLPGSEVRLLDNARLPWLLLIPHTQEVAFHRLDRPLQEQLLGQVVRLSAYLEDREDVERVNVAWIGNLVPQLHIHLVGRREGDYCWPGVVWGAPGASPLSSRQVQEIRSDLTCWLGLG